MKPPPPDWPRISTALYYEDARRAIEWLCTAFGFEVKLIVEDPEGAVRHSELVFGGGLIMVATPSGDRIPRARAPLGIGGANTQNLMVYVDDVEAHCDRARRAGAEILTELETVDYGPEYWSDRGYSCDDPGGHTWWFFERLRNPPSAS